MEADPARVTIATERLAAEMAEATASIELVAQGTASRVTLTGLRFGRQVEERLRADAARAGVALTLAGWPDDTVTDLEVSSAPESAPAGRPGEPRIYARKAPTHG
jgi:hypothetical protein